MQIAKYFASLGFDVSKNSIRRVDKAFNHVENRFKKLQKFSNKAIKINISGFDVNQAALNRTLGNALDVASHRVVFDISRFVVNDAALLAALLAASRRLPIPPDLRPTPYVGPSVRATGRAGFGVGGVLGGALAIGLGGYGLSQLNRRNQEVVSAQLQTSAVVQQAGGTAAQGSDSFQYLRKEGNRIGFNYLDASGDYNKLIAGLTGSGVSVGNSQKVFSGFAELARVNKLDKTTQNRLFRALSQVAGKGKLQSEELTGQIAEALPGGTALFAQAYQAQLKATGKGKGDLTGQAAIQALLADMKKGVVTSDILTYAGVSASQRANEGGGLATASKASQAEQQRTQNVVSDLAVVASNAGVEEGFARIFRTLGTGLSESNGLVRGLASGFNEATKVAEKLLLFPQSFTRALEGRDSLVADWLGEGQAKELRDDWSEIRISLESILGLQTPEWFNPLKAIAQELKDLIAVAGGISQKYRETKQVALQIQEDAIAEYGGTVGGVVGLAKANYFTLSTALGLGEQGLGYGLNKVKSTLPFGNYTPVSGLVGDLANYLSTPNDTVAKYYVDRDRAAGLDTEAMYGTDGSGWRDFNKERNRSLALDVFGNNGYGPNGDSLYGMKSSADTYKQDQTQQGNTTTTNLFKAEFTVTGDRGDIESWVKSSLSKEIEKVMVTLPEK